MVLTESYLAGPTTPPVRDMTFGDLLREAVGRRLGCLSQEVAERHVPDRRRGRSGEV